MKLQLCVKNHLLAERELEELNFIDMNFKGRYEVQKTYINAMIEQLKHSHTKYLETRNWEIYLVVESKVNLINEQ